MYTHSNRPFGCRHTRSLSFGADCWCFARAAKLMVKLKDRPLTSECRRPGRHRRARAGAAAHTRRVGCVGLVDKGMLTQTCTRRVHSSSEESAAWISAPWSRLIGCSFLLFLWRRRVAIETLTPLQNTQEPELSTLRAGEP